MELDQKPRNEKDMHKPLTQKQIKETNPTVGAQSKIEHANQKFHHTFKYDDTINPFKNNVQKMDAYLARQKKLRLVR